MMGIGFSSLEDKAGARRSTCASVPQVLNLLELLPARRHHCSRRRWRALATALGSAQRDIYVMPAAWDDLLQMLSI